MRLQAAVLLLLILLFGYATPSRGIRAIRDFVDAARRWTINPEFRDVQVEYIRLGTRATAAPIAGTTVDHFVMGMRSVPLLPASLAANPGSQHHYDEFAAGDLRAYFRLSEEQGTAWVIDSLRQLVARGEPSDQDLLQFLLQFKTDEPLVIDTGAVSSLRKLIRDVDPATMPPAGDVVARLRAASMELASSRGFATDFEQLTPDQQSQLFAELDNWVKQRDPDLWRVKQVNDFLNGLWAQSFGQTYARYGRPIVALWWICRLAGPISLGAWIALALRRNQKLKIQSPK